MIQGVKRQQFEGVEHDEMFMLVLATWMLQLATSWVWLSHFRQGPVEALWRRCTVRS
ncbi:MAG: DUF418 domain-containing protein [Pseudomonadota bacterium]